jgi:hypothetical protein
MIDFSSPLWLAMVAKFQADIEQARKRNDVVGLSEPEANANRGEIRILKKYLALPEVADRDKQFSQT